MVIRVSIANLFKVWLGFHDVLKVPDSCCELRDEEKGKETKMDLGHAWTFMGGRNSEG